MAEAVSAGAWLRAMLRFEAALAKVQGRLGLIPDAAARAIASACDESRFDVDALGREAVDSASPAVPLVDALRAAVGPETAPFVHHGSTSQDVLDTAMMLVSLEAVTILLAELRRLGDLCASLAREHAATPMFGRTLLQQAQPVTFGFKAAMWLQGVDDSRMRLSAARAHDLAVQAGGPVGTGWRGDVVAALASELRLGAPALPWQSSRGRVAALAGALAVASGAATKIAIDVQLLAQTEVAEVAVAKPGRSSSMPHKRNAAAAVEARAAFALAGAQAGILYAAMVAEHERAAGAWQAEWPALSELFRLTACCVDRAADLLTGLRVDSARMRENLGDAFDDGSIDSASVIARRAVELHTEESDA